MEALRGFFDKAAARLQKADRRLVVAAGATAAVGAVLLGLKFVLTASDGPKHQNDDQQAILRPQRVTVEGAAAPLDVLPITKAASSYSAAAECLAVSHAEDPMIAACGAEGFTKERREKSLRWLYGALLRAVTPSSTGCIPLQTAGGQAVAVWFSKSHDLSPLQVMLAGGWQYVWRYSGWARRGRFPGYAQVISSVRSRLMSAHAGAFFYLLTFARRPELPEAEGRAQLAAVMQPVFERADALGQPCYVEVTKPAEVPLLASLGFAPLPGEVFTLFSQPVTVMVRPARK